MPGIDGGSSTSFDYAPHMYILREGGDSNVEADYIYVSNAETRCDDQDKFGATYKERIATIATLGTGGLYSRYHIGISPIEGLVADVRTESLWIGKSGKDVFWLGISDVGGSHRGLSTSEIPKLAIDSLISEGLRQISNIYGHTILGGLGIELPTDLEPMSFARLFNGTPAEQAAEHAKKDQWERIADELRQAHGIR